MEDLRELKKKKKELKEQLKRIEKDIEEHNAISKVRQLNDIPDSEKIKAFDDMYSLCFENIEHVIEKGYEIKDIEHWIYEMAINITLGKNAWPIINTADNPY